MIICSVHTDNSDDIIISIMIMAASEGRRRVME